MSYKKKILIVILIIVDIGICFVGSRTYSKYESKIRGNEGATIAGWNFKVNGENEQIKSINLMQTCKQETLTNGKIAPGTSGYFDIIIDATGTDVGIYYEVIFENENEKPTNLIFTYEGINYSSIKNLENVLKGNIDANDPEKIKVITIDWKWPYDTANSQIDTQDGLNLKNYTFDIVVKGIQILPEAT